MVGKCREQEKAARHCRAALFILRVALLLDIGIAHSMPLVVIALSLAEEDRRSIGSRTVVVPDGLSALNEEVSAEEAPIEGGL